MDIFLLTIAIYLLDTLTATRTTITAHHASCSADITDTLHAVQTTRPRLDTAMKTPANVLIAFRATFLTLGPLGKVTGNLIAKDYLVLDGRLVVFIILFVFGHWYTVYEHFFP